MKTNLSPNILSPDERERADKILRSCVHCGFCNATCPTYQLRGDELDGPRGRIYLIKQMLEGEMPGKQTQLHLDRCLTCRSCETTCPSGVKYSQLLDLGRAVVNRKVPRPPQQRFFHYALRKLFLSRQLFSFFLSSGQFLKPILPQRMQKSIPAKQPKLEFIKTPQQRKILLVSGCVQPGLQPNIDLAAKIVFKRLRIECLEPETTTCCGALSHHLNAQTEALGIIKANIDRWWPLLENKTIEAICMTASGCGVTIKEYGQMLSHDSEYASKAEAISQLYKDPAEIISQSLHENPQTTLQQLDCKKTRAGSGQKVAFHPPCTLQHGLQINHLIEPILSACGYALLPFTDTHLCCGSAGTYSITQKLMAQQLLSNKLSNIEKTNPDLIVSANIGCQLHLQSGTNTVVKHWLELLV